jgi:hypothetical protein
LISRNFPPLIADDGEEPASETSSILNKPKMMANVQYTTGKKFYWFYRRLNVDVGRPSLELNFEVGIGRVTLRRNVS